MAFLTWSDQYSVHVKAMDHQHRSLVDLVNQLHDAMQVGKGNEVAGKILDSLVGYTLLHFAAEEKLMQSNGFPGFAQHKAQHEALAKQVADVQKQFKAGKPAVTIQLMGFLRDWLLTHIKGSDAVYGTFLNAKGIQ